MAYLVSVVLIQGKGPVKAALPVLKRGPNDQGPVAVAAPFPTLTGIQTAASDALPAMRLGDDLIIAGTNLGSQNAPAAIFQNSKAGLVQELTTSPSVIPGMLAVHVPSLADKASAVNEWAAGMYAVSLRVSVPNLPSWVTNGVPIALAPTIAIGPAPAPPNFHVGDTVTITCTPRLAGQQAASAQIIFGSQTIAPATVVTPSANATDLLKPTTLTFVIPTVAAAAYIVRLRVDGVDSLPITLSGSPLQLGFDNSQRVIVQ